MKAKILATILIPVLVTIILTMPALGGDTDVMEKRAKLEALLDRYVASCSAKSEMLNSRSETIRKSAIRSCRIASFCVTSKEALVNEMLAQNIEPKPYKVSMFLNEKFRMVVLANE